MYLNAREFVYGFSLSLCHLLGVKDEDIGEVVEKIVVASPVDVYITEHDAWHALRAMSDHFSIHVDGFDMIEKFRGCSRSTKFKEIVDDFLEIEARANELLCFRFYGEDDVDARFDFIYNCLLPAFLGCLAGYEFGALMAGFSRRWSRGEKPERDGGIFFTTALPSRAGILYIN